MFLKLDSCEFHAESFTLSNLTAKLFFPYVTRLVRQGDDLSSTRWSNSGLFSRFLYRRPKELGHFITSSRYNHISFDIFVTSQIFYKVLPNQHRPINLIFEQL